MMKPARRKFPALLAAIALAAGFASTARAADPDPIADCERFAISLAKAQGSVLKSVHMDRDPAKLWINRFEQKVGGVMVSVEYVGWAEVAFGDNPPERQRFVCLHTGDRGRAIYTVFIPNNL